MQMIGGRNQAGSPAPNMGQAQPQQGGWGQPQQPAMQSQPTQQPPAAKSTSIQRTTDGF